MTLHLHDWSHLAFPEGQGTVAEVVAPGAVLSRGLCGDPALSRGNGGG